METANAAAKNATTVIAVVNSVRQCLRLSVIYGTAI
jgi:hypothetical protein